MSRDDNLLSAEVSALSYISGFCNEELHNLHSSPYWPTSIISDKNKEWDGRGIQHAWGQQKNNVLVDKLEMKRPPRRPSRSWENNTEMDFTDMGWHCVQWINLAQNRDKLFTLVNTVMNLRVP
jgi:hypothetical protein